MKKPSLATRLDDRPTAHRRAKWITFSFALFLGVASPGSLLASWGTLWSLGSADGQVEEFGSPSFNTNLPPGKVTLNDDDYYLAGKYPTPIGTLNSAEPLKNFPGLLASSDPAIRIHFPLTAEAALPTVQFRIVLRVLFGGWQDSVNNPNGSTFGTHDLQIYFNGVRVISRPHIRQETLIAEAFTPATKATALAGPNVLEIRRSGGALVGWIGIDFLQLEINPTALRDADADGLPEAWEENFGLNDFDPSDASSDPDRDGRTNLQEYLGGTDPRNPDTDHDGLTEGEEAVYGTDPLKSDTDGDGLSDGDEVHIHHTNPLLTDTDGDGSSDAQEIRLGFNPLSASSQPTPFAGSLGIQFICENSLGSILNSNEIAGVFPQRNWNSSRPLTTWNSPTGNLSFVAAPIQGTLVNGVGQPTAVRIQWQSINSGTTANGGTPDRKLLDGYLSGTTNAPVFVQLTQIPFKKYDLYAYVGGTYVGLKGSVRINRNVATERIFATDSGIATDEFQEVTSTTDSFRRGNFVHYRGLTNSTAEVRVYTIGYNIGLHAVQIVDTATDTDGDGLPDSWEVQHGLSPLIKDDGEDPDSDRLTNLQEYARGTDPKNPDTDHDGLLDSVETGTGIYVSATDTGTDPLESDSDHDGVLDGMEVKPFPHPSDPNRVDTDSDGFTDADELRSLTEPADAGSTPRMIPRQEAATGQWTWEISPFQLVWDHHQASPNADPGSSETLFSAQVYNTAAQSPYPDFEMALRFRDGKMTWLFRSSELGGFTQGTSGDGIYDIDFNFPSSDMTKAIGFSGFGNWDTSARLRFLMTAKKQTNAVNRWTLRFEAFNYDTARTVITRQYTDVQGHPALADGTATWNAGDGLDQRVLLTAAPGVEVFFRNSSLDAGAAPDAKDSDNDGMPDAWEAAHGLNPSNAADANLDLDKDGLSNLMEFLVGTDPQRPDSDGDGASDSYEVQQGSNPNDSSSAPVYFGSLPTTQGDDFNGNGLSDAWELWVGLVGLQSSQDLDADGLSNLAESIAGTNPIDPASTLALSVTPKGSVLQLAWPVQYRKTYTLYSSTNLTDWLSLGNFTPNSATSGRQTRDIPIDPNGGGLLNAYKVTVSDLDTDKDGVPDWAEVVLGSDPTRASSTRQAIQVDTNHDGKVDGTLAGDWVHLAQLLGAREFGSNPPTRVEASRFLTQATFGPTLSDIDRVVALGFENWIEDQIQTQPAHFHEPYAKQILGDLFGSKRGLTYHASVDGDFLFGDNLNSSFTRGALQKPDQLRQRMAFALSQILVTSRRESAIQDQVRGLANYYDLFVRHAFGNYRDLLMSVSTHPIMGRYLSHVGNQKAKPEINQYPDENYAREIMQLFTIGLWELNPDGSRKLDAHGDPIPTYGNRDITQLARVFTGFWYGGEPWGEGGYQDKDFSVPMVMDPRYHDFDRKELLHSLIIPSRVATQAEALRDVEEAVNFLFNHPNTPVFISRQLIQFFVTYNPSPAYLQRVQARFVDNGHGVRGDLGAVIRAILLDPEARQIRTALGSDSFGKLREPVIRLMHLCRVLQIGRGSQDFVWWEWYEINTSGFQEPMNAPSVFNYYRPDYKPPGALTTRGLDAPAFQITDSFSSISLPNLFWQILETGPRDYSGLYAWPPDLAEWLPLAGTTAALLDRVDLLLCEGMMSSATRETLRQAVDGIARDNPLARVRVALFLALTSPDGAIQR